MNEMAVRSSSDRAMATSCRWCVLRILGFSLRILILFAPLLILEMMLSLMSGLDVAQIGC